MEIDSDKLLENALRDGIREGVKQKLNSGYNSPLESLINDAIKKHGGELSSLISQAIASCLNSEEFRKDFDSAVRTQIAKSLITKFGGEIEKHVNAIKSDPTTRARITVAIDDLVRTRAN